MLLTPGFKIYCMITQRGFINYQKHATKQNFLHLIFAPVMMSLRLLILFVSLGFPGYCSVAHTVLIMTTIFPLQISFLEKMCNGSDENDFTKKFFFFFLFFFPSMVWGRAGSPSALAGGHFDSEGVVSKGLEATHKQSTPLPDNQRNEQK